MTRRSHLIKLTQFLYRAARPRAFALTIAVLALAAPAIFGAFSTTARSRVTKPAQSGAVIKVDKSSYLAGETITIAGSGFTALESIMLQVKHADGTIEHGLGHEAWFVTADANGEFTSTWSIGSNDNAGINFVLTAMGSLHSTAQADFTRSVTLTTRQLSKGIVHINASGFNPNEAVTIQVNQHGTI